MQCVHQQPLLPSDNRRQADDSKSAAGKKPEQTATEITDVSYNATLDQITAVTTDHNILMYGREQLELQKQVRYDSSCVSVVINTVNVPMRGLLLLLTYTQVCLISVAVDRSQ